LHIITITPRGNRTILLENMSNRRAYPYLKTIVGYKAKPSRVACLWIPHDFRGRDDDAKGAKCVVEQLRSSKRNRVAMLGKGFTGFIAPGVHPPERQRKHVEEEYVSPFYCLPAGGCRKHIFWTACVKSIKNYIFEILTSRAVDWYIYGSNRGGGGGLSPDGFLVFLRGVSSFLLGHFH